MLRFSLALLATLALFVSSGPAAEKLKLLIVDGQNNHKRDIRIEFDWTSGLSRGGKVPVVVSPGA